MNKVLIWARQSAVLTAIVLPVIGHAQTFLKDGLFKLNLNEEGTRFVQLNMVGQAWVRYDQNNPGSTIFGKAEDHTFDIGLRRWRMTLMAKPFERVFIYTQFGVNNFSSSSKQFGGFFIHDAFAEYAVHPKGLSIGAGLSGWSGLSRFASPSVGTIMPLDAPLYQQVTNGVNDQFLRKLSVHFKGKINKLDYRMAVTKPLAVQNAVSAVHPLDSNSADFSTEPSTVQLQGYFNWQFFDQESNMIPYTVGTYLGKKKVLNLGGGFIWQPNAMWKLAHATDTLRTDMKLFAIDVFYDAPLNAETHSAITVYAAYHYLDLGYHYVRNLGVMNVANGTNANGTLSGAGNAFPMVGTGSTMYAQLGYKFKDGLFAKTATMQPYATAQVSLFDAFKSPMVMFEGGVNIFTNGTHASKVSIGLQNRPIFERDATTGDAHQTTRRNMVVMQYQISF